MSGYTYLLDANIFIQAKNLHYGFDFCPAFWDWILTANRQGKVFSIDKVKTELNNGNDDLSDWVEQQATGLFLPSQQSIVPALGQIAQWITSQTYEPGAIQTFFQVADYYLVAHALASKHVLVTHEVPANSVRRIKIPNVCLALGVSFMTPYQMLRQERARFVLGA